MYAILYLLYTNTYMFGYVCKQSDNTANDELAI